MQGVTCFSSSNLCLKLSDDITSYVDSRPIVAGLVKRVSFILWLRSIRLIISHIISYQYCHYVAGLVGIGLSKLFSASGLEATVIGQDTDLANSMGLFLQKTNIIRDYLEDIIDGRVFWPKSVSISLFLSWVSHVTSSKDRELTANSRYCSVSQQQSISCDM